jgi:hypothetical protein
MWLLIANYVDSDHHGRLVPAVAISGDSLGLLVAAVLSFTKELSTSCPHSELRLDTGPLGATVWITTTRASKQSWAPGPG